MSRIKRSYIDSHWLIFAVEGIIALICGWYVMFVGDQDTIALITIVGVMLLALGLMEAVNVVHRERAQATWGISLTAAVIEIGIGLLLLFTSQQNLFWHMIILATYTFIRGLCELLLAFRSIDDRTDRFIWGFCGVCGIVLSLAILNSGHLGDAFMRIFASYLMILGIGNLLYGIHNRDQKLEDQEMYKLERSKTKKSPKKRSTKKTTTSKKRK